MESPLSEVDELKELAAEAHKRKDTKVVNQILDRLDQLETQSPQQSQGVDVPRVGGLTARYAAEGLAETADIFTNPIRAGMNAVAGAQWGVTDATPFDQSTSDLTKEFLDKWGLPRPRPGGEQVIGTASKLMAGTAPFVKAGQFLSRLPQQVSQTNEAGKVLSQAPGMQMATAGAAGAGGEYQKQAGQGVTSQLVGSLVAGLTPATAQMLAKNAASHFTRMAPNVDEVLLQFDLKGVPLGVIQNLRLRVQNALNVGEVDQQALGRMVDYAKVGATPTQGRVTRDPVQFTQEENLSRQAAAGSQNPDIQRLAQIKGENIETLISGLDDIARGTKLDLFDAGEITIKSISDRNDALRKIQKGLYQRAEDMAGREIPLNREEFIRRADIALKQSNRASFLPAEVKTMLNDIAYGTKNSKGEAVPVPFNVNVIDQLETILAAAQRTAGKDGNAKTAIGAVKKALMDTDIEGNVPEDALKAYRAARAFSRKLFEWQKKSPAIHAIVEGNATPDQFMQQFVIGATKNASHENLSTTMKSLPKEAKAIVRNQVAAWIKAQATANNADELQIFTQSGLRNALDKIGDRKLLILFGPEEVKTLRRIQRVGSYEQAPPAGSAVNFSNSANTMLGEMANWAEKWTSMLPGLNLVVKPTSNTVRNYVEGKAATNPDIGIRAAKDKQALPLIPLGLGAQGAASD